MAKAGRNGPCPCGSGKKVKHCCGERASRYSPSPGAPLHLMDERVVDDMLAFANHRFGRGWLTEAREEYFLEEMESGPEHLQLFVPWAVHHWGVQEGRPVREWFLEEQGGRLSEAERAWLLSQASSVVTLWEVLEVREGEGVTVNDRLGGETRFVHDVKGSRTMGVRNTVLGRVVDYEGVSVFCGVNPGLLPPREAAEAEREARAVLETPDGKVSREKLTGEAVVLELIHLWMEAVLDLKLQPVVMPRLTNTDGDPLLLTVDHFVFKPQEREQVLERLLEMKGAELAARGMPADIVFLKKEAMDKSWKNTVVGTARAAQARLRLETNSVRRADELRMRVEAACAELLTYQAREHSDPETLLEALRSSKEPVGDWR